MKKLIEAIPHWPVWRLSGGRAYLMLMGVWIMLNWGLGSVSNAAYSLSILTSCFGPTALFGFLGVRHWMLRSSYPAREGLARRIGCILASGVTGWLAIETVLSYESMNDAPRGLVWDFNVALAPLVGAGVLLLSQAVVCPSSLFKSENEHNQNG